MSSDTTTTQITEEAAQDREADEEVTYSPAEEVALSRGWLPKEEFPGPEENWVTAPEYNRRTKLVGKINAQKHELREMKTALQQMHAMMIKNNENAYQQALNDLQAQRYQALQEGQTDKVMQLDQQLQSTQAAMQQSTAELHNTGRVQEIPEFFQTWREQNDWYGTDAKQTAYADALAKSLTADYQAQGRTLSKEVLLEEIAKEVKQVFGKGRRLSTKSPDVLGGSQATTPPAANNSGARGRGIASLPPQAQTIARTLIQATGMTEAEYMKQYKALGGDS